MAVLPIHSLFNTVSERAPEYRCGGVRWERLKLREGAAFRSRFSRSVKLCIIGHNSNLVLTPNSECEYNIEIEDIIDGWATAAPEVTSVFNIS